MIENERIKQEKSSSKEKVRFWKSVGVVVVVEGGCGWWGVVGGGAALWSLTRCRTLRVDVSQQACTHALAMSWAACSPLNYPPNPPLIA